MTLEQSAAYVHAKSVAAQAEIEAMKAANAYREMQGHTIAYDEESFLAIIDRYGLHSKAIMTLYGEAQ